MAAVDKTKADRVQAVISKYITDNHEHIFGKRVALESPKLDKFSNKLTWRVLELIAKIDKEADDAAHQD